MVLLSTDAIHVVLFNTCPFGRIASKSSPYTRRKNVPVFHRSARAVSFSRLINSSCFSSRSFASALNSLAVRGGCPCPHRAGATAPANHSNRNSFFMYPTSASSLFAPSPTTPICALAQSLASIASAYLPARALPPSTKHLFRHFSQKPPRHFERSEESLFLIADYSSPLAGALATGIVRVGRSAAAAHLGKIPVP
jgi:hypothetical protein